MNNEIIHWKNQDVTNKNIPYASIFIEQKIKELTDISPNNITTFLSIIFQSWIWILFLPLIIIVLLISFNAICVFIFILLETLMGGHIALGMMLIIYICCIIYLCLAVHAWIKIQKLQKTSLDIYNIFKQTKSIVEDIPNILTLLETIHSNILFIQKIEFLWIIFSKKSKIKLEQLITLITQISLYVIYNLRSDLIKQMTEQQKGVQSALWEINTLFFTEQYPFMNATCIRLNQQIQQFEKLKEKLT